MLKIIFTLDYEIHGNGDGCPLKLMVKPTYRLMKLMDKYGAKLTIFADMAEIIKFKEYYQLNKEDKYNYLQIKAQLQQAVIRGHDVQLHIHSSFFNSKYEKGKWVQDWKEYDFANLDYSKINQRVKECKDALESMIQEKIPDYKCQAFRAANWTMQPTKNIATALLLNSLFIDSSVYKYGKQKSWVNFDYSNAFSSTFPYKASTNNICQADPDSMLWEFPIHCELRPLVEFIAPIRVFRIIRAFFHKHKKSENTILAQTKSIPHRKPIRRWLTILLTKHPLKFDFNQLTGRQMIKIIKNIGKVSNHGYVVITGHSKSFIVYNVCTLRKFLKFITNYQNKYEFSLFPKNPDL